MRDWKIEYVQIRNVNYRNRLEYYLKSSAILLLREGKKCVTCKEFKDKYKNKVKITGAAILAKTIGFNG